MLPAKFGNLRIRSANNGDRAAIETLVFDVLREFDLSPDPENTDADLKDIEANYLARGGVFEVIEDDQGLVGTIGLYPVDVEVCELRKMYLVCEARGQGLGKHLLERAVIQARDLGFKHLVLETSNKLPAAIRLYVNFGFHQIEFLHPSPRADRSYALDL
jgi:putative acetyltransferase